MTQITGRFCLKSRGQESSRGVSCDFREGKGLAFFHSKHFRVTSWMRRFRRCRQRRLVRTIEHKLMASTSWPWTTSHLCSPLLGHSLCVISHNGAGEKFCSLRMTSIFFHKLEGTAQTAAGSAGQRKVHGLGWEPVETTPPTRLPCGPAGLSSTYPRVLLEQSVRDSPGSSGNIDRVGCLQMN